MYLVVIGVDGAVSNDVRCGRDIASCRRLVLETEAYGIEIWRGTREMQEWIELVALGMI